MCSDTNTGLWYLNPDLSIRAFAQVGALQNLGAVVAVVAYVSSLGVDAKLTSKATPTPR